MTTWQQFLVEHAKFPFPTTVEGGSVSSTDISYTEVGTLTTGWKAKYAVPDETLVLKLCETLENILGDTLISDSSQNYLLSKFGYHLQYDTLDGEEIEDTRWFTNGSQSRSRMLLDKGPLGAAIVCLRVYGRHRFNITEEHVEPGTSSKVDYLGLVGDKRVVLVEAKSPSIMKVVGHSLPTDPISLEWARKQTLVRKILLKAALHLGLRKMEWLFFTCHNYWIICRLVSGGDNPFLAFSPMCSIENSSETFRALLGAILSVLGNIHVQPSEFNPNMVLDITPEEEDDRHLPEDDTYDGSKPYRGGARTTNSSKVPTTRSRATTSRDDAESGLMITSSSPRSLESFQVWVHLHSLPNNTFVLPHCAENGSGKRRLWLTRLIGFGSTGNVWECHFDKSDSSFAIKIIEMLRRSDVDRQRRFYNELEVYLTLDMAYESGQLRDRIAPHCYGAFEGDGIDVLVLELCGDTLKGWDDLNPSERTQVYGLVWDLHRVGIVHGDLEPRNVARVPGGGFCLIDFSECTKHTCVEISGINLTSVLNCN
ncbi:hypothetical protein BJY52DRAFT_1144063 [Lactarius psammicola]|nr:hypothetical protein BJY52DRAFT_1144063 [Lactarius psammicola]